jgi:CheY-like chemotaxis protein
VGLGEDGSRFLTGAMVGRNLTLLVGVTVTMTFEPPHILVLEDDSAHRKVIEFNLIQAGFKVTTAAESAKALSRATRDHFDLVIADYYLPDYPGTDFIRLLREFDGYKDVPAILLTGRADELDRKRLRNELSVLLLSKPYPMAQLVDTVSKCLAIKEPTGMESKPKRILAVDDNGTILKVIRFTLGQAGYDVTTAGNGREAWNLLEAEHFDLVLTDYEMPEMDGEALCRQMRQTDRLKGVPIIVLTGKGLSTKWCQLLKGLDVYEIILKPFSPTTLIATVEACLEKKEACTV